MTSWCGKKELNLKWSYELIIDKNKNAYVRYKILKT